MYVEIGGIFMDLKEVIRSIPNYPQEGVIFRDITTLLKDPKAMIYAIDELKKTLEAVEFDYVLGPESRGFIFGMPVAYEMQKGFIPIRKKGKLPHEVVSQEYELEYGTATIEMHKDALKKGDKVVIVDDLLATGGTAKATIDMVEKVGAEVVGLHFLIELDFLKGRENLKGYSIEAVLHYE